ncbi:MAG: hypothetical protein HQK79_07600 [Desulfobacterales bacterium]|nr:hypothetical protein [Desulfobacterales bacterium]MBF0398059.1 hypothetical protein [Desulfobacterales bacterium]
MKKKYIGLFLNLFLIFLNSSCSAPIDVKNPLDEIRSALTGVQTYSIILDDMKEEGNFIKTYYHKYKIVTEEKTTETDWKETSKNYFDKYYPFLGMTIWSKKDGKESTDANPPGYEYVGNSKYGQWKTDSSGNSFWEFYGKYRMFSDLLGGFLNRDNYNTYTRYQSQRKPYYGPNNEYGTNGSFTKQQKPNFFARKISSMQKSSSSFSNKFNERIGRSSSSLRGRGGSTGK